MKDKLDAESRAAIVDYRLERAEATLTEADYNTELRVVINVLTNLKRFHRPVSSSLSI